MELMSRDVEILTTLTTKVRVMSVAQIGRIWWPESTHGSMHAWRRLKRLEALRLVSTYRAMGHPLLPLASPIIAWQPGEPIPAFASASYCLKSRWNRPPQVNVCVIATATAAVRFGGYAGRKSRATEQSHDLHLSEVYLHLRARSPELAKLWRSETDLQKSMPSGGRLPDAMIDTHSGPLVIEFGGGYSKEKLAAFHAWCAAEKYPYEVW
jgi:hypothetical protein